MGRSDTLWSEADVISEYSRREALDDGVLVDLTPWAKETGFRYPVACTQRVWTEVIEPDESAKRHGESERGRAHDVLWMLFVAIRQATDTDTVLYSLLVTQHGRQRRVQLKSICGPGDEAEPVITIMYPDED